MFKFDLQLFGGGGKGGSSQTVESSYQPTPQEKRMWEILLNNAEKAEPGIGSLLNQYNTGVQSEAFQSLLPTASGYISGGQNLLSQTANGQLNPALQANMADSVKTAVNATVGNAINQLGNRGVINSSVTNKGLNDISANVSDSMAKAYLQGLGTQAQLGGQLISAANAGYSPYQTIGNMAGQMGGSFINNAASAMGGKGTQSQTQTQPGVSFFDSLGSLALGLGTGWVGKQMGLGAGML